MYMICIWDVNVYDLYQLVRIIKITYKQTSMKENVEGYKQ